MKSSLLAVILLVCALGLSVIWDLSDRGNIWRTGPPPEYRLIVYQPINCEDCETWKGRKKITQELVVFEYKEFASTTHSIGSIQGDAHIFKVEPEIYRRAFKKSDSRNIQFVLLRDNDIIAKGTGADSWENVALRAARAYIRESNIAEHQEKWHNRDIEN